MYVYISIHTHRAILRHKLTYKCIVLGLQEESRIPRGNPTEPREDSNPRPTRQAATLPTEGDALKMDPSAAYPQTAFVAQRSRCQWAMKRDHRSTPPCSRQTVRRKYETEGAPFARRPDVTGSGRTSPGTLS